MNEEEKSFLIKQVDMYLQGLSFRQIAKEVGQSHVTVRNNITKKIKYIAPDKYEEVLHKIAENTQKTIDNKDVRERILEAYRLLTEENKTVIEIADILGTTEFTIYRDLTKRLKMLNESAPEIVTNEMLEKSAKVLQIHQYNNLINKPEPINIDLLKEMFPTAAKREAFINKCVLTFGLRLETLSTILKIDIETLKSLFYKRKENVSNSITMVLSSSIKNQDIAYTNFTRFFRKLTKASQLHDKNEIESILTEISDKDAYELLNELNNQTKRISENDIITILKFQTKYMLDLQSTAQLYQLDAKSYEQNIENLADKYPDLVSEFNYLCKYYENVYQTDERGGRK